jgi:hypothetical protein
MGNWNINIQGVGSHHNASNPEDADLLAADFVEKLKSSGHSIEVASFTHGSKEDITLGRNANQLNRIASLLTAAALLLFGSVAMAAEQTMPPKIAGSVLATPAPAAPEYLFRAGEVQLDVIGQLRTDNGRQYERGAGIGLNYFPSRAIGFGVEARARSPRDATADRLGAAVILRMPFDHLRLAPEFRLGIDYDIESRERDRQKGFDAFAGAGAELRLVGGLGIAAEARFVHPLRTEDREHVLLLLRARYSF